MEDIPTVVDLYFTIQKDDGNFIDGLCNLCKPLIKSIRGQHKVPSNFTKHIKVSLFRVSAATFRYLVFFNLICICNQYFSKVCNWHK